MPTLSPTVTPVVGWPAPGVASGNDVKPWLIGVRRPGCWLPAGEDVRLGSRERLAALLVKPAGLVAACGASKGSVCG